MLALAKYALKGPYQAATIVGILAVTAVFFPLITGQAFVSALFGTVLIVMSGALVGLIILTQGTLSGLKAIVVAVLGITVVTLIVLQTPLLGISFALAQWLPIIILAHTLKSTKSMPVMILTGVVLAIVVVAAQSVLLPELELTWLRLIQLSIEQMPENPAYQSEVLRENFEMFVHWMVLLLVPVMFLFFVSILLLSRWLQAKIADSDGYSKEFKALALGKPAAMVAAAVLASSYWLSQDWIASVTMVIMAAFLYQGIAVVHSRAARSKHRTVVIGIFYALLLIFPQVLAVTSMVGVIDNWLIFRKPRNIEST
jgi:hypothetical protein